MALAKGKAKWFCSYNHRRRLNICRRHKLGWYYCGFRYAYHILSLYSFRYCISGSHVCEGLDGNPLTALRADRLRGERAGRKSTTAGNAALKHLSGSGDYSLLVSCGFCCSCVRAASEVTATGAGTA